MNAPSMRFNLTVGQFIELDGRMLSFARRGRDRDRRLIFEGVDGVPADMTDQEFLDLQHKERRLKLLTAAEASQRLEKAERPRISLLDNDAPSNDEARLRLDYIRGWEREGCPSRTEQALRPIVAHVFDDRRDRRAEPVERFAPSPREVLRWIGDWVASGGDIEAIVPQTRNRGNRTDRLHPKARDILERVVEDRYLVDTRPTAVAVHAHVQVAFAEYNGALPEAERLAVPSIKTVHRIIAGIDRYTLDCTRIGRRTADHKWRPVMSAPQTTRHNEVWETDHTPVDAIVLQDGTMLPIGRALVTSCLDRHTRAVTGFHIGFDAPGTYPALECMRVAILPKDALLASCPDITAQYPCMGTRHCTRPAETSFDACLEVTDGGATCRCGSATPSSPRTWRRYAASGWMSWSPTRPQPAIAMASSASTWQPKPAEPGWWFMDTTIRTTAASRREASRSAVWGGRRCCGSARGIYRDSGILG